jgi:hypothetical protein
MQGKAVAIYALHLDALRKGMYDRHSVGWSGCCMPSAGLQQAKKGWLLSMTME